MTQPNEPKPPYVALDAQIKALIRIAKAHRKHNWLWLEPIYARAKAHGLQGKFFRDFCSVKLVLPQRTGFTTWCQNYLEPEDLYISKVNWNSSLFACQVTQLGLQNVDVLNPPNMIVLDGASYMDSQYIESVYDTLGGDPKNQVFLLLG